VLWMRDKRRRSWSCCAGDGWKPLVPSESASCCVCQRHTCHCCCVPANSCSATQCRILSETEGRQEQEKEIRQRCSWVFVFTVQARITKSANNRCGLVRGQDHSECLAGGQSKSRENQDETPAQCKRQTLSSSTFQAANPAPMMRAFDFGLQLVTSSIPPTIREAVFVLEKIN
jgi:hypothetical protein